MQALNDLPHRLDSGALTCRAIVETPHGSRAKFDYDRDSGLFELAGMLPAGMAFPLDFGFIPSSLGEDGDPLDVLILAEETLPVGCLVTVRLLGVIEANQTERRDGESKTVRNDRLVGRLAESHTYANIESLDQLGKSFTNELTRFFTTYNQLKGKGFDVLAVKGAEDAAALIGKGSPAKS